MNMALGNGTPKGQQHMENNRELRIEKLSVNFGKHVNAVVDVSLKISSSRSFCLIGESAAGKSTIASAILRVLPVEAEIHGDMFLGNTRLNSLSEREMREARRRRISLIPQDARGSLVPNICVGKQIQRILSVRLGLSAKNCESRGRLELERVGLAEVDRVWHSTPDQLSGGMCQRVMIALAVASDPEILIADEALTSVDAPAQVELLQLILELHESKKFSLLVITHDLRIASRFNDVGVLKNGRLLEMGETSAVLSSPQHSYTKSLVDAANELGGIVFKGG